MNAVTVVLVVFSRIDPALSCDRMGAACAVLETETFDFVAQLRKRGRSG
jgi:hypothetical protein